MIPRQAEIRTAVKTLPQPKKILALSLLVVFLGAIVFFLWQTNRSWLTIQPRAGGSLREGVVGTPHFVNPLLATSGADRDLVTLVYSGLVRAENKNGEVNWVPDLAEHFNASADGRTYTFTLRPDLIWHDGQALTADDVVFTINLLQDPNLKSPRRGAWEGIEVEKIDNLTVRFTLKQPYGGFLENATLGILPAHLWNKINTDDFALSPLNLEAIGSGPYRIKKIVRNNSNSPTAYELGAFVNFALGEPHLQLLSLYFYPSEEEVLRAYEENEIESLAVISPQAVATLPPREAKIISTPLPRIFAVFFNQNQADIFTQKPVRQALDLVVDKPAIVTNVLAGYGQVIDGPLISQTPTPTDHHQQLLEATDLLLANGWATSTEGSKWEKKGKTTTEKLAFTLATSDAPELKSVAELIVRDWNAFGAEVKLEVFDLGALNQNVIRPREYEALFFGEIVGRQGDLYPFWHSSQRLDPGLNIALYTNITSDQILEDRHETVDNAKRQALYQQFTKELASDRPAIFLYAPHFIYVVPDRLKAISIPPVNLAADRFSNIYHWYTNEEKVWDFLAT